MSTTDTIAIAFAVSIVAIGVVIIGGEIVDAVQRSKESGRGR